MNYKSGSYNRLLVGDFYNFELDGLRNPKTEENYMYL
jgi:hypothetical protein